MKEKIQFFIVLTGAIVMFGLFYNLLLGQKDNEKDKAKEISFYDLSIGEINFSQFRGKVVLLTNIATRCGFTKQLEGLQKISEEYKEKGLVVLGIPSNDFLSQTPEEDKDVVSFCKLNYGVTFLVSQKTEVIGKNKHSIFKWIQAQKGFSTPILWNFEKFFIDKEGKLLKRFRSATTPDNLEFLKTLEGLF